MFQDVEQSDKQQLDFQSDTGVQAGTHISTPPQQYLAQAPKLTQKQAQALSSEIAALLAERGSVSNLSLKRALQPRVHCTHSHQFKGTKYVPRHSSLQDGEYLLGQGCYAEEIFRGQTQLKDTYLSVPIAGEHRKYFRFRWQGTNYEFKTLPFRIGVRPKSFYKNTTPHNLRKKGIRLVVYLDDILVLASRKHS